VPASVSPGKIIVAPQRYAVLNLRFGRDWGVEAKAASSRA
jgi:hypothetical protein